MRGRHARRLHPLEYVPDQLAAMLLHGGDESARIQQFVMDGMPGPEDHESPGLVFGRRIDRSPQAELVALESRR